MFSATPFLCNAGLVAIQEASYAGPARPEDFREAARTTTAHVSPQPKQDASADRPPLGRLTEFSAVGGKQGASGRARSSSSGSGSGSSEQSEPSDGNIDEVSATFATLNAALRRQAQLVRAFSRATPELLVELLLARVYDEACAHLTRCRQTPLSSMVSTSSSGSSGGGVAKGGGGGNSGSTVAAGVVVAAAAATKEQW